MKKAIKRLLLAGIVQLLAFEFLAQAGVHLKESTSELLEMALWFVTLAGMIWATHPAFPRYTGVTRASCRGLVIALSFTVVYSVTYLYSWHLRPNLGLYREPDWVAQHPQFQKELSEKIRKNMWKSPD
jgi:hypothetical protein